jgi:hypothetical protein
MNSFVTTRELAALRRDEILAEAARERRARASRNRKHEDRARRRRLSASPAPPSRRYRPAQCEALAEPAPVITERLNHSAADPVGSCLP